MFETIFIWTLYAILPAILIHRFLGPKKAGFILATTIFLHQTGDINNLNQVSFPSEIASSADSTTILVSSYDKHQPRKFTPALDGRQNYGTGTGGAAGTGGGGGSSNPGGSGSNDGTQPGDNVNPVNPNKGRSLSDNLIEANQPPPRQNWQSDIENWEKDEDPEEFLGDTCEEDNSANLSKVQIDFDYEKDSNGNPNLLVKFFDKTLGKERTGTVYYDQSCTHLHHASEIGVPMPAFFEDPKTKAAYIAMNKPQRLEYARKNIPRKYIIAYQNAIGNSMVGQFGVTTRNFRGIVGINKVDVTIIAQTFPTANNGMVKVTVIRDNGDHATTYPMTVDKFVKLNDPKNPDGFWLFPTRPF